MLYQRLFSCHEWFMLQEGLLSLQLQVVNQSAQNLDHMLSTLAPARDVADWPTSLADERIFKSSTYPSAHSFIANGQRSSLV